MIAAQATKTILIIEDDQTLANRVGEKLSAEGYDIDYVTNGDRAWDKIRAETPDLILLDVMLPGLDGLSLCRMIRNDKATSHIPIVMLTARGTEVDKIVGLESGADDYIVKPFGLGELLARVRAVFRRPSSAKAPVAQELVTGNLTLDIAARRAYLGDEEIRFSNKEFDLLVELIRNTGMVLSRDLILAKVWGYDYFVDKRTVDVHVRWLRQKIEVDASNPRRIITVRGVGYRFEG
jgi:DNA-binding response OmpR family regulator